jgi:hypothetical protein
MKSSKIPILFLILLLVAGCGGGGSGTPSPTLISIAITPENPIIALGVPEQFIATGTYSNNSKKNITASVSWTSSVPDVATISNAAGIIGVANPVKSGVATITAKSGNVSGSTTATVVAPALVAIDVEPAASVIATGLTRQFTAIGTYSDNSTADLTSAVTWTAAPDVATIDSSGLSTAVSTAGTATTVVMARSGNATGSAVLTVTGGIAAPAGNVIPITVNGSLCSPNTSASYPNKPCVSVTICIPGTLTCQTISDILLDTGSSGLRIFKQALTTVSLTQIISGSGSVAECAQFGDGSSEWGPVEFADVTLGDETAKNVPIQVIDSTFGTYPSTCGTPDTTPSLAGFTGILGVGVFVQDCGLTCENQANNGMYYSCSGSTCTGTTVPLSSQVQNPVALLPTENNGVILELPTVPSNGSQSVNGMLVLGIGTKANNAPSGVTAYKTDAFGEITTIFGGTYSGIIDSGSNGLFFTPPSIGLLPNCPSPDSDWFCPSSITTLSANNEGASGSPSDDVFFQIGNFMSLANSSHNVFSNLGGSSPGLFDWGLPFYFGRNVYVGFEGQNSGIGTGPYFAY